MTTQSTQGSPIMLPDGSEFPIWQDETEYRKVYYVDQQHPGTADDNPGTEEAPFLTIQAAAEIVGPAEKVLDHLRAKPAPHIGQVARFGEIIGGGTALHIDN